MPNWCYNTATLTHKDPAVIQELVAVLNLEEPRVFQHLRPLPKEEEENWYTWQIQHWGTKWDMRVGDYELLDENTIIVNFDTAWSPPTTLYAFLTENGWEVDAMYHECGMCFVGRFYDGFDNYKDYNFEDEDWKDGIDEETLEWSGLEYDYESWLEEKQDD